MATISRQRMDVCVCVCNSVYSVCTGKGSSQSKHKHKHKRSRVSPSRAEPTIVGTLHVDPKPVELGDSAIYQKFCLNKLV